MRSPRSNPPLAGLDWRQALQRYAPRIVRVPALQRTALEWCGAG